MFQKRGLNAIERTETVWRGQERGGEGALVSVLGRLAVIQNQTKKSGREGRGVVVQSKDFCSKSISPAI